MPSATWPRAEEVGASRRPNAHARCAVRSNVKAAVRLRERACLVRPAAPPEVAAQPAGPARQRKRRGHENAAGDKAKFSRLMGVVGRGAQAASGPKDGCSKPLAFGSLPNACGQTRNISQHVPSSCGHLQASGLCSRIDTICKRRSSTRVCALMKIFLLILFALTTSLLAQVAKHPFT